MTNTEKDSNTEEKEALVTLLKEALYESQERYKRRYGGIGVFDEFHIYSTGRVKLRPASTTTVEIEIPRRVADFEVTKLIKTGTDFTVQIKDWSNDRDWFSAPIDSEVFAGGLTLPRTRFVPRCSKIFVKLTNCSGKENEVSLSFIGYNMYLMDYAPGCKHVCGCKKPESEINDA